MKKSDLKTGMIVEKRSGEKGLIILNNTYDEDAIIFNENSWTPLGRYSSGLIWFGNMREFDIIKVYITDLPTGFLSRKNKFGPFDPIWERKEEETILTLDGIEYSESTLRSLIKKATR